MGTVSRVLGEAVVVDLEVPCKPGDGVVFDAADWRSPQEREEGGNVYGVSPQGEMSFANGAIDFGRIRPGDLVWRTHDHDLEKLAKPYTQGSLVHKQRVDVLAEARVGAPLRTVWTVGSAAVTVESPASLEAAQSRGLTLAAVREQFERLGTSA